LGETPDVSEVLWGLWAFHTVRAELATACEIANEFLQLAEQFPYPGLALRGHLAMELTLVHIGEFAQAMEHFEQALSFYDPEQHRDDVVLYSQDSGVAMLSYGAWALWFLGQPDRSLERMQEALALANELAEPHGLAHAFYFASILHHLRREEQLAREYAEAAIKVSSEHGLTLYQAMSTITRGWASFDQGSVEEGIQLICHGLAAHVRSGTQVARPHFLALLGEAQGRAGQAEDGLRLLDEAITSAERNNEGCYLAELYRVKGELELVHGGEGAEACFRKSIEIAQRQQAKSLELRTAMSLARLYRGQDRAKGARDLLAPVYGCFTEGFDTLDLREAKALLEELGHR